MSAKYNMATWFNISAICRFLMLYLDLGSIVGSTTAALASRREAIGSLSCGRNFCIACSVT
jgi:hypothetical protein